MEACRGGGWRAARDVVWGEQEARRYRPVVCIVVGSTGKMNNELMSHGECLAA